MSLRRRFLGALAAVVVLGVFTPTPAHANPLTGVADTATCRQAPLPDSPTAGLEGFLVEIPENPPTEPHPKDTFAKDSKVAPYDMLGFGGLQWPTYDLGCIGTATNKPGEQVTNAILRTAIIETALSSAVTRELQDQTFLESLKPLADELTVALRDSWWRPLMPIGLGALAIVLVVMAFKREVSKALSAVIACIIILGISTFLVNQPRKAIDLLADVSNLTTDTVGRAFTPSNEQAAQTHRQVLYTTWATGMFGDANSETAKKFGPEIIETLTYTWSEYKTIKADPAKGAEIRDRKQGAFKSKMDELSKADPIAYEHATGQHLNHRGWRGFFGLIGTFAAQTWKIIAGIAAIFFLLNAVIFGFAFIFVAPFAVIPKYRLAVLHLVDKLAGAFMSSLVCSVAAGLVGEMVGVILAAPLAGWLVVTLLIVTFVGAWIYTRRRRRFLNGAVNNAASVATKLALLYATSSASAAAGKGDAPAPTGDRPLRDRLDNAPSFGGKVTGFTRDRHGHRRTVGWAPDGTAGDETEVADPPGWVAPGLRGQRRSDGAPEVEVEGGNGVLVDPVDSDATTSYVHITVDVENDRTLTVDHFDEGADFDPSWVVPPAGSVDGSADYPQPVHSGHTVIAGGARSDEQHDPGTRTHAADPIGPAAAPSDLGDLGDPMGPL